MDAFSKFWMTVAGGIHCGMKICYGYWLKVGMTELGEWEYIDGFYETRG